MSKTEKRSRARVRTKHEWEDFGGAARETARAEGLCTTCMANAAELCGQCHDELMAEEMRSSYEEGARDELDQVRRSEE